MGLVSRILLLCAGLAVASQAFAAEATLVADAHVNSALPGVNSGAISNLNVGGGYTALLQFDLAMLPAGVTAAQVTRAMLRLYCNRVNTAGMVSLQPVSGTWGEYSVTYATMPSLGAAVQTVAVSQAGAFVTLDVTSLVQGWISAPATNNGVALTAGSAVVQFDSKENDLTGHAAALDVTLASPGPVGLQGPVGLTGPPGARGPQGSQGSAGIAGPQGPAGPAGFTGPQGLYGPQGPQGLPGTAGPIGAQGSPGMVYRGPYASTTNYALGDVVLWQGTSYTSLLAGNHGNTPSDSPVQWGVLSPQGDAGVAGPQGVQGMAGMQGPPGSMGPPGERGDQGLQGIPGQAGAQGLTGAMGPQGQSGPMGPQGVPGVAGMSFQGPYSSTVNYALADSVIYGGSGYISLVAGNHGNTPDSSPIEWALFATGTVGSQGSAGATGPPGAVGPTGSPGAAGTQGPVGATGPQGPAVANYTGNYASTTNYGLHDAVSYMGSTYISMVAGNQGHTPDQSPTQWALLAAQGPAGPAGAAGPAGPTGAAGLPGPAGAMGPQGPPVSFTGQWSVNTSYPVGSAVSYGGSGFIALVANTGREPDMSPIYWALLVQAGAQGAVGATGATGLQGPTGYAGPPGVAGPAGPVGTPGPAGPPGATGTTGPQGVAGAQGAVGQAGLVYQGTYAANVNYAQNDAVSYAGSSYISLIAGNRGNTPDQSSSAWSVLAAQGAPGTTGATGAQGLQGAQGIPGPQGVAGPTGAAGAVGVTYRGVWAFGATYRVNDVAGYAGATYLATAGSAGAEPDSSPAAWAVLAMNGSTGATGPSGSSATLSVGTVTTGAAGTQATVTNSGTAAAAVLNFTLPQGAPGANGAGGGGGGGGTSGIPFASIYHAVSYNSTYYSVTNSNSSGTEADSVLTWVPAGCTATQLSVFSRQGNPVTVTLRQGTAGTMADTALACTVASGSSCTESGNVTVGPGSFVDLSVKGANGNVSSVWIALACN